MTWLLIALIVLCILSEGFFSGAELAIISIDRVRLRTLVGKGVQQAKLIAELLRKPQWLLGTTLLGTNLSTVAASSLATYLVVTRLGDEYEFLAIMIMSPLVLIFAEIIPKTIAHSRAEQFALRVVGPLSFMRNLLEPVVRLLASVADFFTKLVSARKGAQNPMMSREDLEFALRSAGQRGGLKAIERQMIRRILEFKDTTVEEVMIPLIEVVALDVQAPLERAIETILKHGVSRLPLYRDRVDNVVGVLIAADLLFLENREQLVLAELMRKPQFVPPSRPIRDMLAEFRKSFANIAVVVDEYGGAVGIVTPEDILEEIVGEIEDEFDPRKKFFRQVQENLFIVDARTEIKKLRDGLGLQIPDGEYDTLAGFILDQMKRIPKPGETLHFKSYSFRIAKATDRTVEEVQVQIAPSSPVR